MITLTKPARAVGAAAALVLLAVLAAGLVLGSVLWLVWRDDTVGFMDGPTDREVCLRAANLSASHDVCDP